MSAPPGSSRPGAATAPTATGRRRAPFGGTACLLAGLAFLAFFAWGNRRSHWCPVRLPLTAGLETTTREFVPENGALYEVEIEVDGPRTPRDWQFLEPLTRVSDAPLDLRWQVLAGDQPLVGGDAREAAYVVARTTSWRGRLKDALLFETFHRNDLSRRTFGLRGGGTLTRGLGHFRPHTALPHQIRIQPGTLARDFTTLHPTLNVRRSRQEWVRHQRQTRLLGFAGYGFLAAALVLWGKGFRHPTPPQGRDLPPQDPAGRALSDPPPPPG